MSSESESESSRKRPRTTESESDDGEESEMLQDPLDIAEEAISKYHEFIDHVIQVLSKEEEEKEKIEVRALVMGWISILERGNKLVGEVKRRVKTVWSEMEWLEGQEDFEKEFLVRKTYLPQFLGKLGEINSSLGSSPEIAAVSDIKNRAENCLPMCLAELRDSKKEVAEILESIKVIKQMERDAADD